jgi:phosphoglycolate phosphatase
MSSHIPPPSIRKDIDDVSAVDLVVFDHDGTLVNSLPVVVVASNEVMAAFGYERKPAAEIVAGMVHPTAPRLGLLAGTSDLGIQQKMARLYVELALRSSALAELYPGIEGLLGDLQGLGLPLAVLSNSAGIFVRTILDRLEVARYFFRLTGEEDMPAPKPDARGLHQILDLAGCGPQRAVYVGDSRTDLETARAAGVQAIGVTWGAHPRAELEDLGWNALVDEPSQLFALLKGR